ncbi:helix-hairpin-helix domain-containing protein [Chloroflexota bacterium]
MLFLVRQPAGEPLVLATRPPEINITVYISGEVVAPGVYQLPSGSRVVDALEAAGGVLPGSNINYVNLAQVLFDADQVFIPKDSDEIEFQKVNINFASQSELESLPGIGSSVASQIIQYRIENGLFENIEEIQKVSGIGPATYEKIKNFITIGG